MAVTTFGSLSGAIENIDSVEHRFTLYAPRPWTAASPILAGARKDIDNLPSGYEYMLEVILVREAIEVWSTWRDGRVPTTAEACEAVIYYAEHDAYQPEDETSQDPDCGRWVQPAVQPSASAGPDLDRQRQTS